MDLLAEASRLGVERALICTSAVEHRLDWIHALSTITPLHVSAEASVYSASACIHDRITLRPGSLGRLLVNSREAVRVGFDLNWNFVWMKPNFYQLESVVRLASEVGIKRVRILRLMLNGRARENRDALALPIELEMQCESIIGPLTVRFPKVHLTFSKPLAFRLHRDNQNCSASCGTGDGQLVVQADGTVLPCIGMKGIPEFEIGNVRTDTIREILARTSRFDLPQKSREFSECPAILFQQRPELTQLILRRN
jgi:pyrroloquinoline quinone biosynthesis protein E